MINISDIWYAQGVVYLKTAPFYFAKLFYFTVKWKNLNVLYQRNFRQITE